jgi:lysosomal Pro-X carboxypeptidase
MTGLMWENAPDLGALLIFAEHRYFGKSLPFPGVEMPPPPQINYLQTDQALADYATLINALKTELHADSSVVIGFGGSYGGMLCSWLRIKYPSALDGCIAGSAPIVNFEYMEPPFNYNAFAQTETYDASTAGGANDLCKENIRQAWKDFDALSTSSRGLDEINSAMKTCPPLRNVGDVQNFMAYAEASFGNMAMSSYPYPSAYLLLGGKGVLPAYPMRVACGFMTANFTTPLDRLVALRNAIGVFYNNTKDTMCLNMSSAVNHASQVVGYLWGYLSCTTMFMPAGQDGENDMFYPSPWNTTQQIDICRQQFPNIETRPDWVQISYGGRGVAAWGSNIVFSNGRLDPWHNGGILNATAPTVATVMIPDVGHHIDLMFSDPKDTPEVRAARALELKHIRSWINQKRSSDKHE